MRRCRRSQEPLTGERRSGDWLRGAFRVSRVVGPVLLMGCGSIHDDRPAAAEQAEGPRTSHVGRVSCAEGASRACMAEVGTHGSVTSCFSGTEQCSDGAWGPCRRAGLSASSGRLTGVLGRLAFSGSPVACEDNPCDPTCHNFLETPAGGLVAQPDPSGATTKVDATLFWKGGSALDWPPESPWTPGEITADCEGYDLALGIPCAETLPVCNRGSVEVPAGVKLVHFPSGSVDLSSCAPDASDAVTCTTPAPIQPGRCVAVSDCPVLDEDRDVFVNPDGPGHVDECTCGNNWAAYTPGLECQDAPSCFGARLGSAPDAHRVHAFFAVDKSSPLVDGHADAWTPVISGLGALFASPEAAGLDVAMELFPSVASGAGDDGCFANGSCSTAVSECANPAVPFGVLSTATGSDDAQEAALLAALSSTSPAGATPSAAALEGALTTMRDAALANPDDAYAVVLVGTGISDVCVTDSSYLVELAEYFHQQWGILTFTVAPSGADQTVMDAVAEAGGTDTSRSLPGWGSSSAGQSLLDDLIAASGAVVPLCTTELGNAEHIDPTQAVVRYLHGDGSSELLDPVASAEDCAADGPGWYYDDPSAPASFTLCPGTCSSVQEDSGAEVRVELPCLGDPSPVLLTTTVSEVYPAECPEGTRVQWGFMGYSASTPSDSRIILSARTADQQEDLAAAQTTKLRVIAASLDNLECEIAGGCYVDLFDLLDGVPDARRPVLELQVVLVPSTYNETPVLADWQITYSCPASV
ncbi:MAG: hypothetical protein JW940_29145 [Polyangiaceae bacterium]|nr:hypothetical protein [Polyangiaceae bacterium]